MIDEANGNTKYPFGKRVRVVNITDPHDLDLNGRTGILHPPFRKCPITDVGIRLDRCGDKPEQSITVYANEFEVI